MLTDTTRGAAPLTGSPSDRLTAVPPAAAPSSSWVVVPERPKPMVPVSVTPASARCRVPRIRAVPAATRKPSLKLWSVV